MSITTSARYKEKNKKKLTTTTVNPNANKFFTKVKKRLDKYTDKVIYSSMKKRDNINKIDVQDTIDVVSHQITIKNVKGDNKMDLLQTIVDTQTGIQLNTINKTAKLLVKSASKYFSMLSQKMINLSPVYQRPYTYNDESSEHWGNEWQKSLIGDFLKGSFIQPIHLLENTLGDYQYWIIDGGHRTRTLFNFFINHQLKTAMGLMVEWNGKAYDIGGKTWKEILIESPELVNYLEELNLVLISYDVTIDEGRKLFLKLNDLHSMNHMEKLNSFLHSLAETVRDFGDVSLSKYPIFKEFTSKGLVHINLRTIKRTTDELVLWMADFVNKGGYTKYDSTPLWPELKKWYAACDESKTLANKWKPNTKNYKHLDNLLSKLNNLVMESDRKRTQWKKHTMFKMAILIDYFFSKENYNWNSLDIDWIQFNKHVDLVMSDVKKKGTLHHPHTRYQIIDNKVKIKLVGNPDESYEINSVFGGDRIDDIEFWLFHMITSDYDFGISKVQKRSISDSQKLEMFTGNCDVCGKEITLTESRGDHRVPHAKDGMTEMFNGQSTCDDCNRDKSSSVTNEDRQKSLNEYIDGGGRDPKVIHKLSGVTN